MKHRLLLFWRRNVDWVSRLMPLAFTAFFCFVSYSIFTSLLAGLSTKFEDMMDGMDEEMREQLMGDNDDFDFASKTRGIVEFIVRYFFTVFFTFGYTFTAGSSAVIPMIEKKGGLRHMMHLFGLSSKEYWIGMKAADLLIALLPGIATTLTLYFTFDYIMGPEYVGQFFVLFMFFANCMDSISYLLSHLFSDPETAVKYISLFCIFILLIGPYIGFIIIGSILDGETGV